MNKVHCPFLDSSTSDILRAIPALHVHQSSEKLANTRVAIIGGSIGGLVAAACLRAAGFSDVTIYERNSVVMPGAGIS